MDGINNSISKDTFPENAKVASVSLVEKELIDENKVSNFRPVSALNVLLKYVNLLQKISLLQFGRTSCRLLLESTTNLITQRRQPLTIITNHSILDVAEVLDPPLTTHNIHSSDYLKNGEKILIKNMLLVEF